MPWAALAVGDGVRSPDGAWHEVTRVEDGWIELDGGPLAFPVPAGECWGWDRALAQAAAVVSAHLGGVELAQG
jgi:hypothetical protein